MPSSTFSVTQTQEAQRSPSTISRAVSEPSAQVSARTAAQPPAAGSGRGAYASRSA